MLTRPTEAKECSDIISFHIQCNKGITYHNFSSLALVSLIHIKFGIFIRAMFMHALCSYEIGVLCLS